MACLDGKHKAKPKTGRYLCKKCGSTVKKKSQVCQPKKIKAK